MTRAAAALAIAAFLAGLAATDAPAQTAAGKRDTLSAYAQAETRQRSRLRIRISPRCFYRTDSVPFPVPYECEAPGPGYVRECESWLVQQARPSGTVVVPEMRCWWVRD